VGTTRYSQNAEAAEVPRLQCQGYR